MTAELVVMNRSAAALAADSAVTINAGGGTKIYGSVNKIFALSKYQPVGVMIYGEAELAGVPWETAIKMFRERLFDKQFDTLGEYAYDLVNYLGSCHELFPPAVQKECYEGCIRPYFEVICDEVRQAVEKKIEADGALTPGQVSQQVSHVVAKHWKWWAEAEDLPFVPTDFATQVRTTYESSITRVKRKVFEELPLPEAADEQLDHLALWVASKIPPPQVDVETTTGVVVVGFGGRQHFPCFWELEVHTVLGDQLICWVKSSSEIDRELTAVVSAFAQKEMVSRFMTGIDPDYQNAIEESLDVVLKGYADEILKRVGKNKVSKAARRDIVEARSGLMESYRDALAKHRKSAYIDGVTRAVQSLPLEELAEMAESLVNLTKLKRRVSMETESVGGPIDVAVITRGDGFIWIKRKHYFEPDRNPQFFSTYNRRKDG